MYWHPDGIIRMYAKPGVAELIIRRPLYPLGFDPQWQRYLEPSAEVYDLSMQAPRGV